MKSAFSLLELIFAIVVLGIVASFAIPKYIDTKDTALVSTIKRDINTAISSIQGYYLLNQKIATVKEAGKIVESDKILIMAALNVVHDLLKMTMQNGLAIGEFERKINDMVTVCEQALAKAPAANS